MDALSSEEKDYLKQLIDQGAPLPEDYRWRLFSTQSEYELTYAGKQREVDILADTMSVPLQPIKTFHLDLPATDWMNMLIFGDNLQVLKTLLEMKNEGKLKNSDGSPGVRLIYIDPPFATKQEFRGSQDQKAYQDKILGAKFVEFLRKRLVILRELLSDDGCIYVHLDQRKSHYLKTIMDELFGENNFVNEIIWCYSTMQTVKSRFANKHETIFLYKKLNDPVFNIIFSDYPEDYARRFKYEDNQGKFMIRSKSGQGDLTLEDEKNNPEGTYRQYMKEGSLPKDWWEINMLNSNSKERVDANNYPTQKPEELLSKVVRSSSNPGDLVLDCFAGSGTTLAVAEKLSRRWVGVDCGKLAIYTMQKRLLNIAESKDPQDPKKKYKKPSLPFSLYNAGLYDYKLIKSLPWDQYREFALKLFQCRDDQHQVADITFDGYLGADGVIVFNYPKFADVLLTKSYIDDLHRYLKDKVGKRVFIIAPSASVQFLEDYIEKDDIKYYTLRIPYSIIEEIHKRGFTKIKQPVSEMDVNDTVDAVGFDFIQIPKADCKYYIEDKKGQLEIGASDKDCVIEIKTFESIIISKLANNFQNLETLAMVMVDYNYDGEVFNLGEVFFADDLKKSDYQVHFSPDKVKGPMMIIYIDIFGNEKREVKGLLDFQNN